MPMRRDANDDHSTDPDRELLRRVAAGDQDASVMLVNRYLAKTVALAGRVLANRADAEDVAQEVFLRVWQNARRWRTGEARFSTWLYRVTLNLCTDRLRQRRPAANDEVLLKLADAAPSLENRSQSATVSSTVSAAMTELPVRQREAIALCYYQELSNTEAAQVLGISIEALESLLSRGRRGLREILRLRASDLIGEVS